MHQTSAGLRIQLTSFSLNLDVRIGMYSAIRNFTVLIRLAITSVTVIPTVSLIIIYAISAVTVIAENILYFFRVWLSVYVPATGKFL